ncbi:hypothetical protein [Luteimonas aquatica]|uniref:hypothetical protein n=1 Tax=Luteimonas aquatica TaxID=450364 RepID=UPI0030D99D0E
MRKTLLVLCCFAVPGLAQAIDCSNVGVPRAAPLQPTVLSPISTELATPSYRIGGAGSVLSAAYDESQSLDQVLLRLRIEGCANVAKAIPAPSAINPNDPAAYKPQTEFDNTPWRFDMSQNGKRMTAEEFDAWMKARGVRVAKGNGAPAAAPAQPAPAPAPAEETKKP